VALAREAATSGDRIAAENLYQHAEHYFRVMNTNGDANQHGGPRPITPADIEMSEPEQDRVDSEDDELQPSLPMGPGEDQQSRF
jgi:hypothetical protein